jgi:hypothetical protein
LSLKTFPCSVATRPAAPGSPKANPVFRPRDDGFAAVDCSPWARGSVRLRTYSFAHPVTKEVAPMPGKRDAYELLLIEEADAWFEYLEATRAQSALRYKEIEPWAWARLSQRLRAIRTKKSKLNPAAA